MHEHLILRVATKLLVAPIIIYALYVQFHGDYGPGGGFQAGVIFAAAFVLYGLVFGVGLVRKVLPPPIVRRLVAIGLLLYASVGVASLFFGVNYLDYNVLGPTAQAGQHYGILLVELGVGITVAAVMITIFNHFAGRDVHETGDLDHHVDELPEDRS